MTQKTGDNKRKGDSKVKVDRQGGKGVKESAKGPSPIIDILFQTNDVRLS